MLDSALPGPDGGEHPLDRRAGVTTLDASTVDLLARLVLEAECDDAWSLVERLSNAGRSPGDLLSGLLASAAARLDDWWRNDVCSSLEVTLGVCHLRTLALHVAASALAKVSPSGRTAAMLAPAGDRLTFGPIVHECHLEMAGWQVQKLEGLDPATVLGHFRSTFVHVALCSVNEPRLLGGTCEALRRVRKASKNPGLRIVGMGAAFAACEAGRQGCPVDGVVAVPTETLAVARCCVESPPPPGPPASAPAQKPEAEPSLAVNEP